MSVLQRRDWYGDELGDLFRLTRNEPDARASVRAISWIGRLLFLAVVAPGSAVSAHAQSRAYYAGGGVSLVTQTRATSEQPAGTTWGGSVLLGVSMSQRLSIEFEPLFVGTVEGQYTYPANRSFHAHVITRRRDTFLTLQLRARTGFLEPVLGVSFLYGTGSRHATIVGSGRPYFDDRRSQDAIAAAGGIDAVVKLTSRLSFVPTFRAFVIARSNSGGSVADQTRGGRFAFRYGAGARVAF